MSAHLRDEGLQLAIGAARGVRPLARRLSVAPSLITRWRQVPQDRVFDVARALGLEPERLRPDLRVWIEDQQRRRRAALSALRTAAVMIRPRCAAKPEAETVPGDEDLLDFLAVLQAVRFVAGERTLPEGKILAASGRDFESARALAMALADVAAGVSPTAIARVFGCSRQNVNNASARYLRARDGDDSDDQDDAGRVIERGRLRRAKDGDRTVWDAEARFRAMLAGGAS